MSANSPIPPAVVKKILRETLLDYLTPAQVEKAIALWEARFSDKPALALQQYIRELSKHFLIAAENRHRIWQAAVAALMMPEHQTAPAIHPDELPPMQMFQILVGGILNRVNPACAQHIRASLQEQMPKKGVSRDAEDEVLRWSFDQRLELNAPIEAKALQQLVTVVYVALCEALGPLKADEYLNAAVQRASQHPLAERFSPQLLL